MNDTEEFAFLYWLKLPHLIVLNKTFFSIEHIYHNYIKFLETFKSTIVLN